MVIITDKNKKSASTEYNPTSLNTTIDPYKHLGQITKKIVFKIIPALF